MIEVEKKLDENLVMLETKNFASDSLEDIKGMFEEFRVKNVILDCDFEDHIWSMTNEVKFVSLNFDFDEVEFMKQKKLDEITGDFTEFINSVKSFILIKLKKVTIATMGMMFNGFKKFVKETNYFNSKCTTNLIKGKKDEFFRNAVFTIELLEYYEGLNVAEEYFELMWYRYEMYQESNMDNRRALPSFESMFLFDEVMSVFWDGKEFTFEQKEKYYPIKIWWDITNTIPIRATEFILTPYECIEEKLGKYFLTVRRTKLKGDNKEIEQEHNIDANYKLHKVEINKSLYELIREYRSIADICEGKDSDVKEKRIFLFSYKLYLKHSDFIAGNLRSRRLDFFNYNNFSYMLNKFYREIVASEFGLQLVEKSEKGLLEGQIELITPMDTRHFAFISLVLNNVEPLMIKKISGHGSIESSYHYCNHIDKYVKCYTYRMAKRMKSQNKSGQAKELMRLSNSAFGELTAKLGKFEDTHGEYIQIEGGKCLNLDRNLDICRDVDNRCDLCDKYVAENLEQLLKIKEKIEVNEEALNIEIEALKQIIKQNKKMNDFTEQYHLQINKIKALIAQSAYMMSRNVM